jgi:Zn ribbon nucleic-acid-binding protein
MNLARLYAEHICPACGNKLDFAPWVGDKAAERACNCCGIHFGHDDAVAAHREGKYMHWRRIWISYGKRWWRGQPPPDFNPDEQLKRLEALEDEPEDAGRETAG